ncbi:hypothetical protein [Roseovarius sp. E0-M6]|uniref:hypothetical protein n=1 Tax=Roseovarius sp. E0-M6 TaxID=3127118 RepID=UPI00300FF3E5
MSRTRAAFLPILLLATYGTAQERHPALVACETLAAQDWLTKAFEGSEVLSGAFDGRVKIETPMLVRNAELRAARIGFSLRHGSEGTPRQVAFFDITVRDMRSHDRYGAAIKTHRKDPGISVFLSDVSLRPDWPDWISYETTNYDAITLDSAEALYAQAVTIADWNADAAIDSKAETTQLVDVVITGPGHRPLRLWRPGPHYIVHSRINKPAEDTLIWLKDCERAQLRIFASRFNGASRLSSDQVSCETGEFPAIEYLSEDPRQTGEMHPVFATCS